MANINEKELNELRSKADIAEVIGHYLQLHKVGNYYKAICPFHDDHDPSMRITPDKQIYKCFVCGAGGNVFTFVQNYEKVSFPEAVSRVANLVGFQLSSDPAPSVKEKDPHKEALYKVMNETIRYSMYQMNTAEATQQKTYLENRGLNEEIRTMFEIGYNPKGDALHAFLKAKGFEDKDMVECNVVRTGSSGIHDVFQDRILFPIHDSHGNPIGFSARTIEKDNPAKYVNTNDTPLFQKGDIVYNYHRAKGSARKEGKVFVCEGVTDVIAFARAGITNAVCTLGTACTDSQIRLLKSIAAKIVFCYDGDEAGQHATWRACKMARKAGCNVSVIRNDTGKDPDEIIRSQGVEGLQELSKKEISWMEFVLAYLKNHTNLDNYLEKKEFVQKAQAEIAELDDDMDRAYFTEELSRMSGFHLDYQPTKKASIPTAPVYRTNHLPDGASEAEDLILAQMMANKRASEQFENRLGYLLDQEKYRLAMMIIDAWRSGSCEVNALIDAATDQNMKDRIASLATSGDYERDYEEALVDGAIRKIMISAKKAQAEAFRLQLNQPMNAESNALIMEQYQDCLRDLRRYIDEENR